MTKADKYMYEAIQNILSNGYKDENPRPHYADGTPAHTISVNHVFRTYDLSKGEFPICTLRPIAWKTGIKEILWIYQMGSSNLEDLHNLNVNYWDEWESKDRPGTIGQRYGATVNRYHLVDKLIADIQNDPFGRRKVMSLWQEDDLAETDGLAPCAFLTIWNARKQDDKYYLDMVLVQRSGDLLAASHGGGVNEVQYAALLMMIARHCGYEPGVFSHFVANEQLYDRHLEQAEELKKRFVYNSNIQLNELCVAPMYQFNEPSGIQPKLVLNPDKYNFWEFTIDDFQMENYQPIKPQIRFPLGI